MVKALLPTVAEAEPIEGDTIETALRTLLDKLLSPIYMPEIIDGRNKYGPEDAPVNWRLLTTPSIKATGRTKAGTPIVVYAHVQNYFSNPDNIAQAVAQGLIRGAGIIPQQEFYRLVDLAEEQQGKPNQMVFLVDYEALRKAPSGVVAVRNALKHPQTIPFLGGQERTEGYLPRYEKFSGKRQIGIWHWDDLGEQPVGRVLGFHFSRVYDLGGLDACKEFDSFNSNACLVGVRQGAEGAAPQNLETRIR